MRAYDGHIADRREHGKPIPSLRLARDYPPPPERLIFRHGGRNFRLTDVPEPVVRGIPTSALRKPTTRRMD